MPGPRVTKIEDALRQVRKAPQISPSSIEQRGPALGDLVAVQERIQSAPSLTDEDRFAVAHELVLCVIEVARTLTRDDREALRIAFNVEGIHGPLVRDRQQAISEHLALQGIMVAADNIEKNKFWNPALAKLAEELARAGKPWPCGQSGEDSRESGRLIRFVEASLINLHELLSSRLGLRRAKDLLRQLVDALPEAQAHFANAQEPRELLELALKTAVYYGYDGWVEVHGQSLPMLTQTQAERVVDAIFSRYPKTSRSGMWGELQGMVIEPESYLLRVVRPASPRRAVDSTLRALFEIVEDIEAAGDWREAYQVASARFQIRASTQGEPHQDAEEQ